MSSLKLLGAVLLLCSLGSHNDDAFASRQNGGDQADVVGRALNAYFQQDSQALTGLLPSLAGHILEPYFWARSINAKRVALAALPPDIDNNLKFFQGIPGIEKLRVSLLKEWARNANWTYFEENFALVPDWLSEGDFELTCASLLFAKHNKQSVLGKRGSLFNQLNEFPELCGDALRGVVVTGEISEQAAWDKVMQLAVFRKRAEIISLLDALSVDLHPGQKNMASNAGSLQPNQYELLLQAILWAKEDFQAGKNELKRLESVVGEDNYRRTAIYIGVIGARKLDRSSNTLIGSVGGYQRHLPAPIAAWRTRAAILAKSWPNVLSSIASMEADSKKESVWRYWYAQGLKHSGRKKDSLVVLESLTKQPDFYGLLAAEEIGITPPNIHEHHEADSATIQAFSARPEMERIKALYKAGMWVEGALEWNLLLRKAESGRCFSAAILAKNMGLLDRQISFSERAVDHFDLQVRYPATFQSEVMASAKEFNVHPEWIWGVIRQESRFVTNAVSVAGAIGLMQLMPSTAKRVAKEVGMSPSFTREKMAEPGMNIKLGTAELGRLFHTFNNNSILVIAAYNAGQGRARQWRSRIGDVDGTVFTELIPFDETRDYVKRVLSNYIMYSYLRGVEPPKLTILLNGKTASPSRPTQ